MKAKYTIEDVKNAAIASKSIAGVLRKLGLRPIDRLENLQLLCPNCHALTNNYRGKAHLSALSEKRDVECRKFKEPLTGNADGNLEPSL